MSTRPAAQSPNRSYGTLVLHVPLRLLEISRAGCLLETRHRIDDGTAAHLLIPFGSETLTDDVRITRCQPIEGSSTQYRLGAEFLRTRRSASSLRQTMFTTVVQSADMSRRTPGA